MHYTLDYKTDVASRRSGQSVFPNITRGNKYFLEQVCLNEFVLDRDIIILCLLFCVILVFPAANYIHAVH